MQGGFKFQVQRVEEQNKGVRPLNLRPRSIEDTAVIELLLTRPERKVKEETKGSGVFSSQIRGVKTPGPFVSRSTGGQRHTRSRWHFRHFLNKGHCKRAGLFAV
jgi:hypothetical protein